MKLIFVGAAFLIAFIANFVTNGGKDLYLSGPEIKATPLNAQVHDSIMRARSQQEIDQMLQASSHDVMRDYKAPKRPEKTITSKIIK